MSASPPPSIDHKIDDARKSDKNGREKSVRSRSRSRSRGRNKDRDRHRDRDRDSKKRRRSRSRSDDRSKRDRRNRSRSPRKSRRDRRSRSRSARSRSRGHRERSRSSKRTTRRSRDRSGSRRDHSRSRRGRSRSRSYERRRRGGSRDYNRSSLTRDRSYYDERDNQHEKDRDSISRLGTIKEETTTRETRFDFTQTIQDLMNSTSTKNFASLFANTNSNDSFSNGPSENSQDGLERKRRKKSRWGGNENDKTFIPGMPTYLPSTLDPTQQEAYLVQLQIEEISRKLRTGELDIPQNLEERSPSPEPIYSSDGKRLNTREYRCRKRLEDQRHQLIQKMQAVNPDFKPPADYKPPVTRVSDKVLIPQEEHPDINFVGLLIGPRGNTLKAMEKETGAKIIIRGKGSVREGKVGRKDGQPLPGEDEPLHAFITAITLEATNKAVEKVKEVIKQGIEVPQGHNGLRRMQLRELAQLNGTLRENDCPRCTNCGSTEHKSWLCPDKPNVTNNIICTACGGAGHISKDCRSKRPGAGGAESEEVSEDSQAKIDEEYMSLMAELGEGPPPPSTQQASQQPKSALDQLAQVHLNRGFSIFDKKPNQPMQAIQAPPPSNASAPPPMHAAVPPPPIPTPWTGAPGNGIPGIPPLIPPPPPVAQPPVLGAPPPPMMPWMGAQPPIPGGEGALPPPPPPGTTGLMPPGTSAPLPPWPGMMPPGFGGAWSGYAPPPPPPGLAQPPPPPPPSN